MPGDFQTEGYRVARGVVSGEQLDLLQTYLLRRCQLREGLQIDDQVPGALSLYGDPLLESLLFLLEERISELSGHRLFPTYAYGRVYLEGSELRRHVDREACEVSATLAIAVEGVDAWPIHLDARGEVGVALEPGDLLLYRGCEIEHWREPLAGRACIQAFLHYVDREGPNRHRAFDPTHRPGREELCSAPDWAHAETLHRLQRMHGELAAERSEGAGGQDGGD